MNKTLIIGGNLINKGAEAMLQRCIEYFSTKHKLFIYPLDSEKGKIQGSYDIEEINFNWTKREIVTYCFKNPLRIIRLYLKGLSLSDACRVSLYKKFDYILDISGFVYGDKWGSSSIKSLYAITNYLDLKYIILPQAFGPFESEQFLYFKDKLGLKENLFITARDEESKKHIREFIGLKQVHQSFDMVFGGELTLDDIENSNKIIFTPSIHIQNRINKIQNLELLKGLEEIKENLEIVPTEFGFIDSEDDFQLSEKLSKELNIDFNFDRENKLIDIENKLSQSKLVIGCRYHSLVLALRKGIPVIAISWSHKYKMLLKDFGLEDYCIEVEEFNYDLFHTLVIDVLNNHSDIKQHIKSRLLEINSEVNNHFVKISSWCGN